VRGGQPPASDPQPNASPAAGLDHVGRATLAPGISKNTLLPSLTAQIGPLSDDFMLRFVK
jgi:hypothetical protein